MTLEERIDNLQEINQIELAIKLLELGLPIWTEFANTNILEYADSVVGMYHRINKKIVENAINLSKVTIENKEGVLKSFRQHRITLVLEKEFLELVTALEDNDWRIPEEPKLILFSAYNLLEKLSGRDNSVFNESIIHVSINQSTDAIERKGLLSPEEIKTIIKNAG